MRPAPAP